MSGQLQSPQSQTWIERIRRHPVPVAIGALMAAVIFLGQFTKALDKDQMNILCKKPLKALADCMDDALFCSDPFSQACEDRKRLTPRRNTCSSGCL